MTQDQNSNLRQIEGDAALDSGETTARVLALQSQLSTLETFIRRRFDEISMEINATSQQIDMSEEGMSKRFGEILGVMNAISYSGDGTTPANTGVELEAVIAETARAAGDILNATDRMSAILYDRGQDEWADPAIREEMVAALRADVETVMVSCSFQDITSQRITKTLESLGDLEDRIAVTLESMGVTVTPISPASQSAPLTSGASQDDIDALFK